MPVLLLLSGFCGISYEILYTKLLGNLLGNQFTINATVLLTFLLGIGMGTLYAHRFGRFLWVIEAAIGLYAALMAAFYGAIDHFLYSSLPFLGTNLPAAAATSFVLLLVPAFLIGCSIPLFAAYLGGLRSTHVFSLTYGIYNIGAAATALAMEFVLLRSVGLRAATFILATLNAVVALGLLGLIRSAGLALRRPASRIRFPGHVLAALALASVASAVFQLLMIKLSEFILGPYNETFALVLAIVLLGIALGSFVAGRLELSFGGALLLSLAGLAWLLTALPGAVELYSTWYRSVVESYPLLVLLKFGLVFVLMGLPALGFGATIPTLLRSHEDVARESGQLLFCSSVANASGFLLMAFVLHRYVDYGPIVLIVAALTAIALLLQMRWKPIHLAFGAGLLVLAGSSYLTVWDEALLYAGHSNVHALMPRSWGRVTAEERFKGPQDVFAITRQRGEPYFFINGYISIPLSNASEKIVGALSAMISPRLDEALVLGVGSGATAGTVGLIFDHTDAVEINRVVLQNLHRMAEYNFDIERIPNLTITHDDGIRFIRTSGKKYSLILNTVTTPLYFSSSKLYTRDLFDMVVGKLTPDGVYMTWIDVEIGDVGLEIILESLSHSFSECWLSVIKKDYFLLGCSNGEIRLRHFDEVANNPRLREVLAVENEYPARLLPYNIISTEALDLKLPEGAPVNTLDFPVLEFEMARLQADRLNRFYRRLDRQIDLERVRGALSGSMEWKPEEFAVNADLRLPNSTVLYKTLEEHLKRKFGLTLADQGRATAELADEVGTARAYYRYGTSLLKQKNPAFAVGLLARAVEMGVDLDRPLLYLGRAHLGAGEYEQALDSFTRQWELNRDRKLPAFVASALIQLGRFEEALRWLDTATALEEGRIGEKIAYYQGQAFQGLDETDLAARSYREALRADPASQRARLALARLPDRPAGQGPGSTDD